MLETSHSAALVAASIAVSLLAAFTGLSLTRGLSEMTLPARKAMVSMAAVALGGGIWSMHFVAMLGLRLPVPFYYDPLVTLISALVAILMTGLALLLLHFRRRTRATVTLAGAIIGLGVAAMHYIGMSGIELCRPVYGAAGLAGSVLASVGLGIAGIGIAYDARTRRNILLGTIVFGAAVVTVHYLAMAGTGFVQVAGQPLGGPGLGNDQLAVLVTIAAFLICGGFLLTASTFFGSPVSPALRPMAVGLSSPDPYSVSSAGIDDTEPAPTSTVRAIEARQDAAVSRAPEVTRGSLQVPFERFGRTEFIAPERIAAIRAEGHYTILYAGPEKLFCPWSISKARARLPEAQFAQVHRSYLVNPAHVTGFERRKDNGVVYFGDTPALEKVPVSRARLHEMRARLGL